MNAQSWRQSASLEYPEIGALSRLWLRGEKKRTAKALIVGGVCIGWMFGGIYLTVSAHAWAFAAGASVILLAAVAKTVSAYRSF